MTKTELVDYLKKAGAGDNQEIFIVDGKGGYLPLVQVNLESIISHDEDGSNATQGPTRIIFRTALLPHS